MQIPFVEADKSVDSTSTMKINKNVKIVGKSVILVPYRKEHVSLYHAWMVRFLNRSNFPAASGTSVARTRGLLPFGHGLLVSLNHASDNSWPVSARSTPPGSNSVGASQPAGYMVAVISVKFRQHSTHSGSCYAGGVRYATELVQ